MDESPETRAPGAGRLLSGAVLLLVARLATMALGLLQAILLATKFGTSAGTDAFFAAQAACLLFIGPIETVLNLAFVPVFVHEAEESGEEAAWRMAATLCRIGLYGALAVTLVLALGAPWIAALLVPGLEGGAAAQVAAMIHILAPMILITFAASFLSTMDFIAGRYALPAVGMILHSMAGPLSLVLFAGRLGVPALAWGLLAGALARLLLQSTRLQSVRRLLAPGVPFRDPRLRRIGGMVSARVLTTWCLQLNLMVDRVFASFLGPGYISSLAYAHRAVMTIVRLFVLPVGRVMVPALSRRAARGEVDRIRGSLEKLAMVLAFVLLPLVAFLVVFRFDLLGVLFQRGAFDADAVAATAEALLFYSLGIVPFLLTPLLNGTFFSLKNSATPLKVGLVAVVANTVLDALLIGWMGQGGIALATSLVAAIRSFLLWHLVQRQIGALRSRPVLLSLLVSVLAAASAFGGAHLLGPRFGSLSGGPFWQLVLFGLLGSAAYLLVQALLNRPVVQLFRQLLRRRLQARA